MIEKIKKMITDRYLEKMMTLETESLLGQLNTVLDSIKPGIIVSDSQGLITFANQEFENITGIKRSRIVGQHLNAVFNDSNILKVLKLGEEIRNKEIRLNFNKISKRIVIGANPIKKDNKNSHQGGGAH